MNIKAFIKNTEHKLSVFSHSISWGKLLTFTGFLILSLIFWLMLFFQRKEESTYRMPLNYTNIPDDVVFEENLPEFMEVRIFDKGSQLFNYKFLHSNDSITLNLKRIKPSKNKTIQGNQLVQLIREKLSTSTEIRGYYPPMINLSASKLEQKELPVFFDGEIHTSGANLVSAETSFVPETVKAYGSHANLKKLKNAVTEYTIFNHLKETSRLKVKIKKVQGIKFVPDNVEIYIPVKEFTERSFEIPITVSNMPRDIDVKFFPSHANVYFSVTLDDYKKFYTEDFIIQLDYNNLKSMPNGKTKIMVTRHPKTVRKIRVEPQTVEFLFEKK